MMKIALKKKNFIADEDTSASLPSATAQNFDLDDFDLSDSDREDYHNNVDILFVLDTTGSMGSYIPQAMLTIQKIVEKFSKMEFNIKFSLCTYRDHPPQDTTYVTEFYDLTNAKQLITTLKSVQAAGGGDGPEAVMDGLREGLNKTSWRLSEDNVTISKRFMFHICDAPPHGQEYGGSSSDPEWQKNGCPCGTNKEDINALLKKHKVDYHLIKAVSSVDKMESIFKDCFKENYAETIVLVKTSINSSMSKAKKEKKEGVCKKSKKKSVKCDDEDVAEEKEKSIECKKDEKKSEEAEEEGTMWTGVLGALEKKLF
ncbi:hypothetical protein ABPG74_021908 [Tetrahymena malaccensis]